jgi:hypothetical protein
VCYEPGQTLTVEIKMGAVTSTIVGGQFYLSYDTGHLTYTGGTPGDAPFTNEIVDFIPSAGRIFYAVGVPDGTAGTSADTVMARLTFTVSGTACTTAGLVAFAPNSGGFQTKLSDSLGLSALPPITIEGGTPGFTYTPPAVTVPNAPGVCQSASLATRVDFESVGGYTLVGDAGGIAERSNLLAYSPSYSARLLLSNGTPQFAKVIVPVTGLKLGTASGMFHANVVPGSAANLAPYMYFEVDSNNNGFFDFPNDSFVIAFVTGSNPVPQGCWITDGINGATVVHVVGNRTGLAVNEFSSSFGGGLLSALRSTIFSGSTTWGDLNIVHARVGAGEWPGAGYFEAFVDDIVVAAHLEVPARASDACGSLITTTRSDNVSLSLIDPFPVGTTTITWTATDCCGHFATTTQMVTVQDVEAPVITCNNSDISLNADAGLCTAQVTWAAATAIDNCDPSPTISYEIDLGNNGGAPDVTQAGTTYVFPTGTHKVTARATDHAVPTTNSSTCSFLVTVSGYNELKLSIGLSPTVATPLTRCITLQLFNCASPQTVTQEITFTSGQAANVIVLVPCGDYTCITARDKLHTLRRTLSPQIVGTQYVADFIAAGKPLIGGNLNDDSWQYNLIYGSGNTTCATAYPHADISGDGLVHTADFTFIRNNFLQAHEANCCSLLNSVETLADITAPRSVISVADLRAMGLPELALADVNIDGRLDQADLAAWALGARPGKPLPSPPPRRR